MVQKEEEGMSEVRTGVQGHETEGVVIRGECEGSSAGEGGVGEKQIEDGGAGRGVGAAIEGSGSIGVVAAQKTRERGGRGMYI